MCALSACHPRVARGVSCSGLARPLANAFGVADFTLPLGHSLSAKELLPAISNDAETNDAEKQHCPSVWLGHCYYGNLVEIDTGVESTPGVDEGEQR